MGAKLFSLIEIRFGASWAIKISWHASSRKIRPALPGRNRRRSLAFGPKPGFSNRAIHKLYPTFVLRTSSKLHGPVAAFPGLIRLLTRGWARLAVRCIRISKLAEGHFGGKGAPGKGGRL